MFFRVKNSNFFLKKKQNYNVHSTNLKYRKLEQHKNENQPTDVGACGRAGWAGERVRAGVGVRVRSCPRGRVLAGEDVGIRMGACRRMGVLVFVFLVETLYFLMLLFFQLTPVCFFTVSTTRATTHFTLITAHHDRIPSQPYGYFSDFLKFCPPCRDPDPCMDTDVDLEV